MDTQQQYRGKKSKMPDLLEGQLGFCTDSNELYIGTSSANVLIASSSWSTDIEKKLTAERATSVSAIAETATLAEVIEAVNTLINNLKASGIMNS